MVFLAVILVVLIVGAVIGLLMTGGAQRPPAGKDEQLQVATTEVGVPIGILFGTRLLKSPSIVWYGNMAIVKVKVATSGKKG